jgi:uncharacterized protein YbaP (TraB family)
LHQEPIGRFILQQPVWRYGASLSGTIIMNLTQIALAAGALASAVCFPALAREPAPAVQADAVMPAESAPRDPPQSAGPALWQVADEDTTIYLMGTVHVLPGGLSWYDRAIAQAFDEADTIVTELPIGPEAEAEMAEVAQELSQLPEGTTLRSLLNAAQRTQFEAALAALDLPARAFDKVEPWMASLSLAMLPAIRGGYNPDSGTEQVLVGMAPDKQREALETVEFQFAMFDSLSQEKQIAMLMETVEGIETAKQGLDAMVAEWLAGDPDGLAELLNAELQDSEIAETLLYARNARWSDWIAERLDTRPGTVFVAVGAGHLAGERSVQDMLSARGLTVTRLQ